MPLCPHKQNVSNGVSISLFENMAYKNIFCVRSSRSAHYEIIITEGSLEVKLPTIWTDGKAEVVRVREEKRREERRSEKRKSQKNEDAGARKDRKVAIHCVFPMICGPGGSKSRLAKAAGAEPSGRMRDEKVARRWGAKQISKSKWTTHLSVGPLLEVELWREAHFRVKMCRTHQLRITFGS